MKKKLKPSGNGWVLYFQKSLLKLLGYKPDEVKIVIVAKNSSLHFSPVNPEELDKYKNNMVRNFQKSGCGYGIYLPSALIDILEIDPASDYINVEINENTVLVKKAQ